MNRTLALSCCGLAAVLSLGCLSYPAAGGQQACGGVTCDAHATCAAVSTGAGVTCVCNTGYGGDGQVCVIDGPDAGPTDAGDAGIDGGPGPQDAGSIAALTAYCDLAMPGHESGVTVMFTAGGMISIPGPFAGGFQGPSGMSGLNHFCAYGTTGTSNDETSVCASVCGNLEGDSCASPSGPFVPGTLYTVEGGDAGTGVALFDSYCPGQDCFYSNDGSMRDSESGQFEAVQNDATALVMGFSANSRGQTLSGCIAFPMAGE